MKLNHLLDPWVKTDVTNPIIGLENDSRRIKPGDLFFAYPGALADGRLFIERAVAAGAAAIIYEPKDYPKASHLPANIPCIAVPDLVSKLAAIACRFYADPTSRLSVTGVTGTNGKTTIAYQLAQAYDLLGQGAAYIGTIGQGKVHSLKPLLNTTPDGLCLQKLFHDYEKQGLKQVAMEVSSHALAQNRVDHIHFRGAIYTNLTLDHLDYHQTMDAYAEAKSRLFAMSSLAWAVINHDDAYAPLMMKKLDSNCQKITYGLKDGADVRALNYQISMVDSQIEVMSPWGRHQFQVHLLGQFNIYNSLAVFASLLANGMHLDDVVNIMNQLQPSLGRMEVVAKNPCVIVDYAHTPDALENVLTTLKQLKQGRLGVVFGCGGDRDKTKRPIMGRIASQYADFVIVTSDNPRTEEPNTIIDEISEGLTPNAETIKIVDRKEAIQYALNLTKDKDILLIAGKGHENYQQIGKERFEFSDQAVVRELLALREH
jgi:UDP-N-acetylmuramoyl-L-alanyl-D-glutamate--2,6-diaminopimelate ligase